MSGWFKAGLAIVVAVVVVLGISYYLGVRVFVIQPIGAIPKGITIIVSNVPGLHAVDSPDAFCERELGYVSLLCRGAIAGRVANEGHILFRLPYSGFLYGLTGAPAVDR